MEKIVSDYKHNNQTLMFDSDSNTYRLWSYSTMVLEVVNGKITVNGKGKYSVTTSKHITQCRSFLGI